MSSYQSSIRNAVPFDSLSSYSIPNIRRRSQKTRSIRQKAVRKARVVARVASTLRRRRSAFKNRYEKAIIQLLERHGKIPKVGQDGLLYRVQQIPSGHSRASLIGGFDAVIEVMSGNESNHSVTITSSSCESSNKSKSSSELAHSTVDLLGDDIFAPDDFERFLGSDCLKPQAASTSTHVKIQTTNGHDSAEGILIEIGSPDFRSLPRTPPALSDSRPTCVDELFFGNTFRLSIRSLMSPPATPSTDHHTISAPFSPPANLSDSRPPSMDEIFSTKSVTVNIQQSLAQIPEEVHDETPSLLDDPWPKPLAFRGIYKPVQQTIPIDVLHTSPRKQKLDETRHSLARKRGGQDLRINANIKLTVTAPTPEPPRTGQIRTVTNTPDLLASGFPTPRKPLPQVSSSASFESPRIHDHASSPYSSSSSIAYRPDSVESSWLPLISTDVSFCLLDEMTEELDKVMEAWQKETRVDDSSQHGTVAFVHCKESLLDMPIEEDLSTSARAPKPNTEPLRHAASLDSQETLFTNVAALLPKLDNPPEHDTGTPVGVPFTVPYPAAVSSPTIKPQKTSGSLLEDLLTELSASGMSIPRPSAPTLSKRRRSRGSSNTSESRSNESATSSPISKPLPPLPKKIYPPVVPRRSSSKPADVVNPVFIPQLPTLAAILPNSSSSSRYTTDATPSKSGAPITPFLAASPTLQSLIQVDLTNFTTTTAVSSPALTETLAPASSTLTPTTHSAPSFRDRLTKATLDALLDAKTHADFARAWSTVKKTKRESRRIHNSDFAWQRWVDQDFEDGSAGLRESDSGVGREEGGGEARHRRQRRKRRHTDIDLDPGVEQDEAIGEETSEGNLSKYNAETAAKESTTQCQPMTPRKANRRRSNLFEVLGEEKE